MPIKSTLVARNSKNLFAIRHKEHKTAEQIGKDWGFGSSNYICGATNISTFEASGGREICRPSKVFVNLRTFLIIFVSMSHWKYR